ncbi:MAG: hypothetical protein WCK78_18555 [Paludibacter sp.]
MGNIQARSSKDFTNSNSIIVSGFLGYKLHISDWLILSRPLIPIFKNGAMLKTQRGDKKKCYRKYKLAAN